MRTTRLIPALALAILVFAGCASSVEYVYPRVEGSWMYDYASSMSDTGELPAIPQEWMSELKQENDPTRDRLLVLKNPPEILYIERVGTRLYIQGGGRFERTYMLDGTPPSPVSQLTFTAESIIAVHREPEMTITETWAVSADRSTLVVSIRVETARLPEPLDVRRIYRSSHAF